MQSSCSNPFFQRPSAILDGLFQKGKASSGLQFCRGNAWFARRLCLVTRITTILYLTTHKTGRCSTTAKERQKQESELQWATETLTLDVFTDLTNTASSFTNNFNSHI